MAPVPRSALRVLVSNRPLLTLTACILGLFALSLVLNLWLVASDSFVSSTKARRAAEEAAEEAREAERRSAEERIAAVKEEAARVRDNFEAKVAEERQRREEELAELERRRAEAEEQAEADLRSAASTIEKLEREMAELKSQLELRQAKRAARAADGLTAEYYPLDRGWGWTYGTHSNADRVTERVGSRREASGLDCMTIVGESEERFEAASPEGVYLAGMKTTQETGTKSQIYFDPPVMKIKFGCRVGDDWVVKTSDTSWTEVNGINRVLRSSMDWEFRYEVEAFETIRTSAGEFECFRVLETTDPGSDSETKQRLWYGRGMGLVRRVSVKPLGEEIDLLDFEKPYDLREGED